MKKTLLIALFVLCSHIAGAATWYATSSSVAIDTASLWVPTTTGTCTGSGTALVFSARGPNDTLVANGCTSLAVDVDPGNYTTLTGTVSLTQGSATVTGSGTAFTSQVSVNDWFWVSGGIPAQVSAIGSDTSITLANIYYGATVTGVTGYDGLVTLTTATNGGGFTCTNALTGAPATMHSNITAGTTTALVVTYSGGGSPAFCNILGIITGGTSANAYGVSITSCSNCFNLTFTGILQGGSGTSAHAVLYNAGTLVVNGLALGGTAGDGLYGSVAGTINGGCLAGNRLLSKYNPGCGTTSSFYGAVNGYIVNDIGSPGVLGGYGGSHYLLGTGATNFLVLPLAANNSYNEANCYTPAQVAAGTCAYASILVPPPPVGDVANGITYGPYKGTNTGLPAVCGGGIPLFWPGMAQERSTCSTEAKLGEALNKGSWKRW